jgi:uncharacterized protein (DUF3820 family)
LKYILETELSFGKYKGLTIAQILLENPGYVRWMTENFKPSEATFDDEVLEILEREMRKR